jgi:hypothetical protein
MRGGARRQPARRTFCTLSRLSRAPTKQMGPYRRSSLRGRARARRDRRRAIDRVDHAALVDEHVVDLRRAGARSARRLGDEVAGLRGPERVREVEGADAPVEEAADDDRLRHPRPRGRAILVQVVRAIAPAASGELGDGRQGARGDRHEVRLLPRVHHPDQLGPVAATVGDGLVAHDQESAVEEGQERVGEAGERGMVVPAADEAGVRHVGDVEHDGPAVEIADPGSIRPAGIDVRVVGAESRCRGRRDAPAAARRRRRACRAATTARPPSDAWARARRRCDSTGRPSDCGA